MLALRFPNTYAKPPDPITAKALLNEVGRRTADEVLFCDGDGALGAVDCILVHEDYMDDAPLFWSPAMPKGVVRRINGFAHPWRPSVSKAPSGKLALAYVYQNWLSTVIMPFALFLWVTLKLCDQALMIFMIWLLKNFCVKMPNSREPAAKKGVFVDPFFWWWYEWSSH